MGLANRRIVFLMMAAAALCGVARAVEYKVGDSVGWTSLGGGLDYQGWAANHKFFAGDTLVFVYNSQFHDVRQVNVDDYKSCNPDNPIATFRNGSDYITLKSSGEYYFLCGSPGHCQVGQKVHVTVNPPPVADLGPSPDASPSQTSPPKNAAPSPSASKLLGCLAITFAFLPFFLRMV